MAENSIDNTQLVTIGQLLVQAVNGLVSQLTTLNDTLSSVPGWTTVPANATASGVPGQLAYSGTSLFVCYATDSWAKYNGTSTF